jgi:hypothetical protein
VQPVDDSGRHAGGHEQAVPLQRFVARDTASAIVGTCGATAERVLAATPSPRMRPALICACATGMTRNAS